ncbi:MAG: CDP-diacylglycerol--glycerol-3-phosphate 3-phosphatidyltransferase [Janthinobacterium lividum]
MDKNLPNYLTLIRIIIIPVIVLSFYLENSALAHQISAVLFVFASITDFLDGYLARKFNITSNFGELFDPIADKLLVGCVIIMLVKKGLVGEVPCLLILAREFLVAGLREFLAQIRVSVPVSRLARIKTFVQMFALTILILGSKGSGISHLDAVGQIALWIAAVLTLATGYSYFKACSNYF